MLARLQMDGAFARVAAFLGAFQFLEQPAAEILLMHCMRRSIEREPGTSIDTGTSLNRLLSRSSYESNASPDAYACAAVRLC